VSYPPIATVFITCPHCLQVRILTFTKEGFQKAVFQDVLQTAGQTRTLNVTLAIRAQAQAISVVDTTVALDETTATFGGSVQPVQVSKVPINGRNWSTLETLVP
jgi:hypothetical protein